jgi:hypothetical protein
LKNGTLTLESPSKDGPLLPGGDAKAGTAGECGQGIQDADVAADGLTPGVLVLLENRDGPKPSVTRWPTTCQGVVEAAPDEKIQFRTGSCKGTVALTREAEGRRSVVREGDEVMLKDFVLEGGWKASKLEFVRALVTVLGEVTCAPADSQRICLSKTKKDPSVGDDRFQLLRALSIKENSSITAALSDPTKKDLVKAAVGDRVAARILYSGGASDSIKFESVQPQNMRGRVGRLELFGLLGGSAIGLCLFGSLITNFRGAKLFFIGEAETASKSKTQASIWLLVLLSVFLSALILRLLYADSLLGSIAMPTNLALLAGISGVTFVGAKAIRTSKDPAALAAKKNELEKAKEELAKKPTDTELKAKVDLLEAEVKRLSLPAAGPETKGSVMRVLSQDESGKLSLGDFQMVMVTLVALIVYLLRAYHFLGGMDLTASIELPDIDGSIVTLFGVSHGTYLANKAAGPGSTPTKT